MRAWRLNTATHALTFDEVDVPAVHSGSVRVRVEASALVSYQREYIAGRLAGYHPPSGVFTPGTNAVGVIDAVGRDVYSLTNGQRVLLTGHYTVAENIPEPAQALLGITATPRFTAVLETWRNGTFAEQVVVPVSTVTPVPSELDHIPSTRLIAISRSLVPFGGFLRGRLAVGETVVVNGATGSFGSAGVTVALAMGAARVVAAGRNPAILQRLGAIDRVHAVKMTGDVAADAAALRDAAGGAVDCALDIVGRASTPNSTQATLDALGRGGRLVLMGSSAVPVPVDYTQLMMTGREIIGNSMYPQWAPARLMGIVAAGGLNLNALPISTFRLEAFESAMDAAAEPGAPLVVVQPDTTS